MTVPRFRQQGLPPPVHREPRKAVVIGVDKAKPNVVRIKKPTPMRVLDRR